jgi:peptidoglycan/xylan/chitin deacetylase (PgdA/CDA1 family)
MIPLKHLAKSVLCGLYKYSGAASLQEAVRWRHGQQCMAILVFHRVTDQIPEDGLTIGTRHFERLCAMLRRTFHVVPVGEVFDIIRFGRPMPPRMVAITFDDSYRDNLYAARVLARYQLPATFFVPTAYIETNHVYSWDRHLPRMPNLTWADLHEMIRLGFEIGSHTVTHANLCKVSYGQARSELIESKRTLEERLQRPVHWFAYPYGGPTDLRPEHVAYIEEAGYSGSLSAYGGLIFPGANSRVLPRTPVPSFRSLLNLELHLKGCLNWVYALKRRLGWMDSPDMPTTAGADDLSFAPQAVYHKV